MIVTIDGPAGAGKSTVAGLLAERLGFCFLDTGAMYRAVTLAALRGRLDWSDQQALGRLASQISLRFEQGKTLLGGQDVSREIRHPEVTACTRHVADNPLVRVQLVELQRRLAAGANVVTEGRDQGTVAFPQAECKFFLTASATERGAPTLGTTPRRGSGRGIRRHPGTAERTRQTRCGPRSRPASARGRCGARVDRWHDGAGSCGVPGAGRAKTDGRTGEVNDRDACAIVDGYPGVNWNMDRPWWKTAVYQFFKRSFWLLALVFFRFRWRGKEHFPREGGALICCNHQSYFDPVLVGICFRHPINFLARDTLFKTFLFGPLIHYLEAIPIERDGFGISGIKETLRRLKRGEMVLIFPEGTRTLDGQVAPLKPGFCALARRGNTSILPVAVDGAYDAWPRSQRLPHLTKLRTCFGPLISRAEIEALNDEQLLEEVRNRILACHREARRLRGIDA